jgi:hypothetical protein
VSAGNVKTAVIIALLILTVSVACHDYSVQVENAKFKARCESAEKLVQELENQNRGLLENYSRLMSAHELLLQEFKSVNESYAVLSQNYSVLMEQYQKVLSEYVRLTVDYASLNLTYSKLLQNYTSLEQQTLELKSMYENLSTAYQALLANYTEVKGEFEKLYFAFYKPLFSNETVTPSVDELRDWLERDETDKISYVYPDFVCGDFAVMLSLHAKLNHWDMGVVAVLGKTSTGSEFDHAFNAIRCREGLVYVEPQNDEIFNGPILEGSRYYHPGFGWVYVDLFIIVVLYQPPLE